MVPSPRAAAGSGSNWNQPETAVAGWSNGKSFATFSSRHSCPHFGPFDVGMVGKSTERGFNAMNQALKYRVEDTAQT